MGLGVRQRDTQTPEGKQVFSNGGYVDTALAKRRLEGFHRKAAPKLGAGLVIFPGAQALNHSKQVAVALGFQFSRQWRKTRIVVKTWKGKLPEFI